MPIYLDWGERNPPGSLPQVLRTLVELFEHETKTMKALRNNVPALLQQLTITDIQQQTTRVVKISLADPGFCWAHHQENQSGGGDQKELGRDRSGTTPNDKETSHGREAGTESPPEFIYEKEIPLEQILNHLFDLVELPIDVRKRIRGIRTRMRRAGVKKRGPRSRLHRRATHVEKVKREKKSGTTPLPYRLQDRRYKGLVKRKDRTIMARIYLVRDKSGSMDKEKVALVNAFLLLVYWFLRIKYREIEMVCILHDTEAAVVEPEEFFAITSTGGTSLSSGVNCMLDEETARTDGRDIFVIQLSDGENNTHDNEFFVASVEEALRRVLYFGFVQIKPSVRPQWRMPHALNPNPKELLKTLQHRFPNLHLADIHSYHDVKDAFLNLFETYAAEEKAV